MHLHRRRFLARSATVLGAAAFTPLLRAQAWPAKTITMVVPFAAGGGTDIVARAIASRLSARLGQSVVVDNKPGAGTIIGAEAVARSGPDGYTLLVSGASTWSINPAMRSTLRYDALADFAPVGIVATVPLLLLVHADAPYKAVSDLVKAAQASPGTINYATHGPGTVPHLAGGLLQMAADIRMTDVAYKGSAPAMVALLAKEISVSLDTAASAMPQIQAGKVRALANFGAKRSELLPQLATMAEQGLPGATFDGWYGISARGGTPQPVVERLGAEVRAIMRDPEVKALLLKQSIDTAEVGPAAMRTQIESEIARYRALAHRANIRLD